ncbi:MAG: hypothetical protein ABL958_21180 [Bdellovibrionia bacterium]
MKNRFSFRALATLVILASLHTQASHAQTEDATYLRRLAQNISSIAADGKLEGERIRFVVPFSALSRQNRHGNTNRAFYGALDVGKYFVTSSLNTIVKDAGDLAFGHYGLLLDTDGKDAIRDIKPMWRSSSLRLNAANEKLREKYQFTVPAKIAGIVMNDARYVLIDLPVNSLKTLKRLGMPVLQTGTVIVGVGLMGVVEAAMLVSFGIKAAYSAMTVTAASFLYAGTDSYVTLRDLLSNRERRFSAAEPVELSAVGVCSRLLIY